MNDSNKKKNEIMQMYINSILHTAVSLSIHCYLITQQFQLTLDEIGFFLYTLGNYQIHHEKR